MDPINHYENGQKYSSGNQQKGKYTAYYENGQIRYKRFNVNGNFEETWTHYNVDGTLRETEFYENGNLIRKE